MFAVAIEVHAGDLLLENYAGHLVDWEPQLYPLGFIFSLAAPSPPGLSIAWGTRAGMFLPDTGLLQPATFSWGVSTSLAYVFWELCCGWDASNPTLPLLSSFTGVKPKGSPNLILLLPPLSFTSTFQNISLAHLIPSCYLLLQGPEPTQSLSTFLMWYDTSIGNLGSSALEKLSDMCIRRRYAMMFITSWFKE